MSVWNDIQITQWASGYVTPFEPKNINPASLDLRLGNKICIALAAGWSTPVEFSSYSLKPGEFVLCHSLEYITMPNNAIGMLFSKSSTGRIGIEHLHAGYVDPSFHGELTFELHNVAPWPIELVAGKRLMQLTIVGMSEVPYRDYLQTGRYNGQTGPTPAR